MKRALFLILITLPVFSEVQEGCPKAKGMGSAFCPANASRECFSQIKYLAMDRADKDGRATCSKLGSPVPLSLEEGPITPYEITDTVSANGDETVDAVANYQCGNPWSC